MSLDVLLSSKKPVGPIHSVLGPEASIVHVLGALLQGYISVSMLPSKFVKDWISHEPLV